MYGSFVKQLSLPGFSENGISLSIQVSFFTSLLFFMACFLSVSIAQYSFRYLAGESIQEYFFKYLSVLTFSVSIFLLSNNLLVMMLAWLMVSFSLHKLLTCYRERYEAWEASIKKNIVSRIGDLCLFSGVLISASVFRTLEIDQIARQIILQAGHSNYLISLTAILFAVGALIKSVQFPFHFWLPDTMETPTPVSALMHAGVVNAGGIFILKISHVIACSPSALAILVLSGAVSAVFGSLIMITQNSIKKKLAYSTISQMGMMMFACGLQLYAVALFHIFAHSLYKAMAFLSTGTIVEESKKLQCKPSYIAPQIVMLILGAGALVVGLAMSVLKWEQSAYVLYFSILMLGLFHGLFVKGFEVGYRSAFYNGIGVIVLAFMIYLTIEYFLHAQLKDLSTNRANTSASLIEVFSGAIAYLVFGVGLYLSNELIFLRKNWSKRLYVFFWNGAYIPLRTSMILRRSFLGRKLKKLSQKNARADNFIHEVHNERGQFTN